MSNPSKLLIFALLFFLALTYVRGFSVQVPTHTVEFQGNQAFELPVTLSNPSNQSIQPQFIADGPFSITIKGTPSSVVVGSHSNRVITLQLTPADSFQVGDAYKAQIRVLSVNSEERIPLTLTKTNPPLFAGVGSGLVLGLPSAADWVVNGVLLIMVIILIVALASRIRNRVSGGKNK